MGVRRVLRSALSTCIFIVAGNLSPTAWATLNDTNDYWSHNYITDLSERKILSGFPDGSFRPNDTLTRAQFAVIVSKAFQLNAQNQTVRFKDETSFPDWARPAIQATAAAGYISGLPDGTFEPNGLLTRAQALTVLSKTLSTPPVDPAKVESILSIFNDSTTVPEWARRPIASAVQEGTVVLYPSAYMLNANLPATRGDIAALTYLTLARKRIIPNLDVPTGALIPKPGRNQGQETVSPVSWFQGIAGGVGGILSGLAGLAALIQVFRKANDPQAATTSSAYTGIVTLVSLGVGFAIIGGIFNLLAIRSATSDRKTTSDNREVITAIQSVEVAQQEREQAIATQLAQVQDSAGELRNQLQNVEATIKSSTDTVTTQIQGITTQTENLNRGITQLTRSSSSQASVSPEPRRSLQSESERSIRVAQSSLQEAFNNGSLLQVLGITSVAGIIGGFVFSSFRIPANIPDPRVNPRIRLVLGYFIQVFVLAPASAIIAMYVFAPTTALSLIVYSFGAGLFGTPFAVILVRSLNNITSLDLVNFFRSRIRKNRNP